MTKPHVPQNATLLPLDDSSRTSSPSAADNNEISRAVKPRSIPIPVSASATSGAGHSFGYHRPDRSHAALSSSPLANYTLPNVSVTTPPLIHPTSNSIGASLPLQMGELPPYSSTSLSPESAHPGERTSHSPPGSLRISTDLSGLPSTPIRRESFTGNGGGSSSSRSNLNRKASANSLRLVSRTPSLKTALAHSVGSASGTSSVIPSPIISAMGSVTPLPSPLMSGDSPGPWKRLSAGSVSPPQHRLKSLGEGSVLVTSTGESIDAALSHAPKRKIYSTVEPGQAIPPSPTANQSKQPHTRNRSVSEYVNPDHIGIPKRQISVSGTRHSTQVIDNPVEPHMRRELHFAESRGLTPTVSKPPTPPPSESSRDSTDGSVKPKSSQFEYFEARGRTDRKLRRWRAVRLLGQGTFSRVMLATSQVQPDEHSSQVDGGPLTPSAEQSLDRKTLVAVKVCEHGPKGGASEERVEMSLKRELEIMQSIRHPSLVDLKAWSIEPTRALLVLSYCPGGDLFDIATAHRLVLKEPLMRRIFAELIGAVSYLHERRIVHRDIKLENVLVNLSPSELADPSVNWATYPYSVVTLTDLGLSRRIADDEKLETRCGSDDYAAPEVIMGQPYDGRAIDAWSLGVLLYALLEARLPFDPHPGMSEAHRMRSRTSHRIARVEWRWVEYGGDDTDHDGDEAKFEEKGLLGAMEITEGLLKRARSRWTIDKVAKKPWVQGGIKVDGGLRFREEKDGEEVC